ncbi:MAG: methyltransferase domain-containing protein [Planctomycetota bacterium]
MQVTWRLLTSNEEERRLFADLPSVQRLPSEPADPRNRLRHVTRLCTATGTYYLKTFARTQWKNRLWFACSRPRARDDAERELLVTQALRAVGFDAPRPVAYGRRGASSYYLCAELPGTSCRDLLATGTVDPRLPRVVARHCGRLLQSGFRLPDLSVDHVFAQLSEHGWQLAVLDLHNGCLASAGPVDQRTAVRVLRRFVRSVRGLPVPWPRALRFAAHLLRAAGRRGGRARTVLAALPPYATATRYEVAGKSLAYAERNPARTARELRLLQRVWPGRTGETVLDLPCGAGRLLPLLAETYGHRVVQADGALAMLQQARARGTASTFLLQADAVSMPFAERCVDGALMFRFLHHLPPEASRRAIADACRTARRFVVVSFFHPCSAHHLQRRLRQLTGGTPTRFALRLGRLAALFAEHGFVLHDKAADLAFARDLWVAAFVRR